MPKNIDPWEYQYIKNHPKKNRIVWDDVNAYKLYKELRWVYDKCIVNNKFNKHKAVKLETELPKKYPVLVKPITNLYGLSIGAYKANSKSEIKDVQGMVAQPFYEGNHISTDYVVFNGMILDWFSFIGHKDKNGSFYLWESSDEYNPMAHKAISDINFTGIMNVESIGNNIIEIHLRPSLQFFDICGGLIENYLDHEQNPNILNYNPSRYEKTYSMVWRQDFDCQYEIPDVGNLPNGVRSVQWCFYEGEKLSYSEQDEFSYRVFVINGNNLKNIIKYGNMKYKEMVKNYEKKSSFN